MTPKRIAYGYWTFCWNRRKPERSSAASDRRGSLRITGEGLDILVTPMYDRFHEAKVLVQAQMMVSHFMLLAQMDEQRFIAACRHGIVHLTWGRVTARFRQDEFRRLARLLERAMDASPPASVRDRDLRVTLRLDEDCELQMGSLVLLLPPVEFQEFARVGQEAVKRLDEILASGAWDEPEEGEAPSNPLEQFRQFSFSHN